MSKTLLSKHLRTCTNSQCRQFESISITKSFHPHHHPLKNIECLKCGTIWLVCTLHNKKWSRRRYKYANEHLKSVPHHIHFISNYEEYCLPIQNENSESESMENETPEDTILNHIFPTKSANDSIIENSISSSFFHNEINNTFSGLKFIVGNAFSGNVSSDVPNCSLEEINFHLNGLKFTMSMSQKQRFYFSYHNSLIMSAFKESNTLSEDSFRCSRPPLDNFDINMFYFSRKTSLYKNIPHPRVFCLHHHACVSIKDIITHMFAFGLEIDGMILNNSSSINNNPLIGCNTGVLACNQSKLIREKVRSRLRNHRQSVSPLIVYITLWSDDFEPNNVIKHKRKSWLKTITIAPPNHSKVSHNYTYIIGIGSSKHDHEPIHAFFCEELKELQKINYFYSSLCNKSIPVVVETMAICADRPERSSMNKMLSHNGSTTARWKYSCAIQNPNILKSCRRCIKNRIEKVHFGLKGLPCSISNTLCNNCSNWNFGNKLMRSSPPDKYPKKKHRHSPPAPKYRTIATENFQIRCVEITYKSLKEASIFCIHNVYTKKWNKGAAYAYLKYAGVNDSFSKKKIVRHAYDYRKDDNLSLQDCINDFEIPSFWNGPHMLNQCVDAPMHLLFLGILKSIMVLTMNWLTGLPSPKYKVFGDTINPLLKRISQLNLSWIRINPFSSPREYTLGGWISSHYTAFCRIMCIAYAPIRHIISLDNIAIDNFERMILTNKLCFSLLLSKDNSMNTLVPDIIKLFLSMVDNFEESIEKDSELSPNVDNDVRSKSKNCTWMKSNFLSILNLPFQIKHFGHLRHFWDGTHERAIQNIKPYLKRARSTETYFHKKMEEMYTNQFIDIVSDYFFQKSRLTNQCNFEYPEYKVYDRFDDFRVYSSNTDISELIEQKYPISGVLIYNNEIHKKIPIVCKRNSQSKNIDCYQLLFEENSGYYYLGHYFVFLEGTKIVNSYEKKSFIEDLQSAAIILLPDMHDNDEENGYTIITDDWKTLKKNNAYGFVHFPVKMFRNIR